MADKRFRKIKPELSDEIRRMLEIREEMKHRLPEFRRQEWFRYKRLGTAWRKPKGLHSKMRRGWKYRPPVVKVGYRKPKLVRGYHPSGFKEVMVWNVSDLDKIDPATEAARIGGTVGVRKRIQIEKEAAKRKIRILNPLHTQVEEKGGDEE